MNDEQYEALLAHVHADPGKRSVFVVEVEEGEWIRDVTSTHRRHYGPLRVTTIVDPYGITQKIGTSEGPVLPPAVLEQARELYNEKTTGPQIPDGPVNTLARDAVIESITARIDFLRGEQKRIQKLRDRIGVSVVRSELTLASMRLTGVIASLELAREGLR